MEWLMYIVIILPFVCFLFWIFPIWNVWASEKSGQADLAQAHSEQKIQVAKANARLEAAEVNKKAAIIEAEAVAEQIARIGEGLSHHDLYLKWQWIKMMEEGSNCTIYVPTEAGLPILEAGKRTEPLTKQEH